MRWRTTLLCWISYAILALLLQWQSGALDGSWADNSDEPSHYINGVMALDYVKGGLPGHPIRYAERYYDHYPKVALGHWPPLFAAVAAGWFLVAPVSYPSSLVLVGLLGALGSTLVAHIATRWFPWWLACGGGAVWLLLPVVRTYSEAFMAEVLLTLTATLAVLAFARGSAGFGFWSAMALLTKGTGIALALLPPVAIALGRHWNWLRRPFLWQSAIVVIVIAAPWYLLVPGARHERVAEYGGIRLLPSRHTGTALALWEFFGPVLCALAILGLALVWRKLREDPYWLAVVAFLPGHFILRGLVAAWETRHLVMLTPEVLWLSMLGFDWVIRRSPARWMQVVLGSGLTLAIVVGLWSQTPPRRHLHGPAELAKTMPAQGRALVSGGSAVEGAVIAELANIDPHRPSRIVRRGSKVLATIDFLGRSYVSRLSQPSDAGPILEQEQIAVVIVDLKAKDQHTLLLHAYLRSQPDRWVASGRFGERLEMFRAAPSKKDNPL